MDDKTMFGHDPAAIGIAAGYGPEESTRETRPPRRPAMRPEPRYLYRPRWLLMGSRSWCDKCSQRSVVVSMSPVYVYSTWRYYAIEQWIEERYCKQCGRVSLRRHAVRYPNASAVKLSREIPF